MIKMKLLTLYRERIYSKNHSSLQSAYDNMNYICGDEIYEIVNYIENGITILEFVTPIHDLIDKDYLIPHTYYTDGVYIWDAMLIHWIKKYKIKLPEEFLIHINNAKNNPLHNAHLKDELNTKNLIAGLKSAERLGFSENGDVIKVCLPS